MLRPKLSPSALWKLFWIVRNKCHGTDLPCTWSCWNTVYCQASFKSPWTERLRTEEEGPPPKHSLHKVNEIIKNPRILQLTFKLSAIWLKREKSRKKWKIMQTFYLQLGTFNILFSIFLKTILAIAEVADW